MGHFSSGARGAGLALGLIVPLLVATPAAARPSGNDRVTADLDGAPIKLADVGNWYCDDFSYPAIHCFSSPDVLESRAAQTLAVTALDFVTVYDFSSFAGSYMHMSQDYTALVTIGWNDRISSLKGRNSQQSHFYVEWFYGGAFYSVCCNAQVSSLGSWNNVLSSVHRN